MIRAVGLSFLVLGAVHCQLPPHHPQQQQHDEPTNPWLSPHQLSTAPGPNWMSTVRGQWDHLGNDEWMNAGNIPNAGNLPTAGIVPNGGNVPNGAATLPDDPMFDFLKEPLAEGLTHLQVAPDLSRQQHPSDFYVPSGEAFHSSGHISPASTSSRGDQGPPAPRGSDLRAEGLNQVQFHSPDQPGGFGQQYPMEDLMIGSQHSGSDFLYGGASESGMTFKPFVEEPSRNVYEPPALNRVHAQETIVKSPHEGAPAGHKGAHTGLNRAADWRLATQPPLPDYNPASQNSEDELAGSDYAAAIDELELASWHVEALDKKKVFVEKYKAKGYGDSTKDYSQSSAFHPGKHFYDKKGFNVSSSDIGSLNYNFKSHGPMDYNVMSGTPNGRHLLLINLLENSEQPYWKPSCFGKVQYLLPDDLKDPRQPSPSENSILLKSIKQGGKTLTKELLVKEAEKTAVFKLKIQDDMSRFNMQHKAAVRALVYLALSQESFDATLTYLVAIKELVNHSIFSQAVLHVIDSRDDVGYIIPSLVSVAPYDYFPISRGLNKTDLYKPYRVRRQAQGFGGPGMGQFPGMPGQGGPGQFPGMPGQMPGAPGQMPGAAGQMPGAPGQIQPLAPPPGLIGNWRLSWNDGDFRTIPTSDPESMMWYFREDPMVSAHHFHWHMKMSNNQVPTWHPSHGLNMDRRGELFYFMHKQVNCRFNADRLALGLGLIESLSREFWIRPISPGYDSKISQSSGRPYPPRPDGALIPIPQDLIDAENALRQGIRNRQLTMPTGVVRLGYANGVDYGISALGDATEAFEQSEIYGSIHNDGHAKIGAMHGDNGALGVMGTPNVAMRDPLFYKWHKYIDDLIQEYKNTLPAYGDAELGFTGVNITAAHVQSERTSGGNSLFTFMDTTTLRLQSIDFIANPTGGVFIEYDRLNHIPFTYNVNIRSETRTQGLLRIFLIPAGIRLPAHTDITQVAIEMDRFLILMNPGDNYFERHSSRSPFITKSPMPLGDLQDALLAGNVTEDEFNWSGCGWPETMVLPRGREGGMTFRLYMMVSRVLDRDSAMTADWEQMQFTSWSWCGVRRNNGDVPDSRPMGFPLDRRPPNGNWQSLMYGRNGRRSNHFTTDIVISHDPIGTTSGGARPRTNPATRRGTARPTRTRGGDRRQVP